MASPSAPDPRRLRLADIYRLRTPGQVAVSPDGARAAFVVQRSRRRDNESESSIWLVRTDGASPPHRLTQGGRGDAAPAFSPDGRLLAFLSSRADEPEVADAAAASRPTGGDEGARGGDRPKPKPQVWTLDLAEGGEARQVTRRPEGVEEFAWAPGSGRLVIVSRDPDEAQSAYLKAIREDEHGSGPLVIDRVQHKHDARGYLDNVRTHLFVVDVASRAVRQITAGPCDEAEPRWSPDGAWIVFASNRTGDADNNRRTDLWLVRAEGGGFRRLTFGDVAARRPRWSPDGAWVAFVSSLEPENAYRLQHLMAVAVDGAEPVADLAACVAAGFASVGGVVPDRQAATPGDPAANGRAYPVPLGRTQTRVLTEGLDRPVSAAAWVGPDALLASIGDRGQTVLARCALAGGATRVFPGPDERGCTLTGFDTAAGTVVAVVDRPQSGPDLFALDTGTLVGVGGESDATGAAGTASDAAMAGPGRHAVAPGERGPAGTRTAGPASPRRLTSLNADWLRERDTARYERVDFAGADGHPVEALVAIPPGLRPGHTAAPLLVAIHGGPMAYDSPSFRFDRQYWAGQGYLVLMVNYRGSISYGESFCTAIRGRWGPQEHADVMAGVDRLVEMGWADPRRLYCTGFSQGGIMTNWAVGHTDRFRAAASEHGMWDYVAGYGTDDCHLWWQDDLGVPWQNEAGYRRMSPAAAAGAIRTPLLITAGEHDWRCPLDQAELLYVTLKKRGVPTRLVIYQGEHHAISRPRRGVDRLRRIGRWLAAYGGQPLDDDSAEGYPGPA